MRSAACLAGAAFVLALASGCAPLPPPAGAPVPPAPAPGPGPGTPRVPELPRREPMIAVGLAWDLDSVRVIPAPGEWIETTRLQRERVQGSVLVHAIGTVAFSNRPGGPLSLLSGDTLSIGASDPRDSRIGWNGKSWRGRFRIFLNARGKLTVADELPLETYLLGVVPGEIGGLAENLIEAGRAQAIAARSYTLFYRGRRAAEGFDLYGTVEDQVYGPIESERPLATRCVQSTRGQVGVANHQPIRANYCSTCGGITADVWEAWPAPPLPYLVSHLDRENQTDYCAGSPHYRWREEWSATEFMANVARFGPPQGVPLPASGSGDLVDVRVVERSRSGRVWRLAVATSSGEIDIPAYALRQVLRRPGIPNAILRSNLFKIDVRRDPGSRRALAVVASGAGSGHGVGLCQTGALGMARAGAPGERILAHYYPAARFERIY